jgi:N,N-dimethylformamidase
MPKTRIHGYSDKISVKAGDTIRFMVSAEGTDQAQAQLVRLIHGDQHPDGPGFIEKECDATLNRAWPVRYQPVQNGSFLTAADPQNRLAPDGAFTLHTFLFPNAPGLGRQAIMGRWAEDAKAGYCLSIDEAGTLEFRVGDGARAAAVTTGKPLVGQVWYFVSASFDPSTGRATIRQDGVLNRYNSLLSKIVPFDYAARVERALDIRPRMDADVPFLIGGASHAEPGRGRFVIHCLNGKVDRPGVQAGVAADAVLASLCAGNAPAGQGTVAYWDTAAGYTDRGVGDRVTDAGPHGLHAEGVNRPVRGQTGWNWAGLNDHYRLAPQEYGGVEFHDDALTDCKWEPAFDFTVPADLKSGVYAVRLRDPAGAAEEYIPFFVRAATPRAKICVLMPTASYLAYANFQLGIEASMGQAITSMTAILQEVDIDAYADGLPFGLSTYDHHNDGGGVCYTSYHRPIVNMRPKHRAPGLGWTWQFPADLSVIGWLEHYGYDYEVLTDEDLHRDGVAALRPYKVVLNATHAEYYSERMMDATEDYLAEGGRLLYLSGNGYYWVGAFRDDEPWVMEVRKLDAGSRAWQARPGEAYLATTGERGGLWRHRGRPPQKLVGTGFTSEGMDASRPYRRMPDSRDPAAAWIFDGVAGEEFGGFGLAGNGAAGLEIDRYDLALGTPPHALLLATADTFSDNYPLVQEDIAFTFPGLGGTENPLVRCDIVYFTTPNDGAVFSPSSIAWGSALPHNDFDNDVARIMRNVVDAFGQDGPLPGTK